METRVPFQYDKSLGVREILQVGGGIFRMVENIIWTGDWVRCVGMVGKKLMRVGMSRKKGMGLLLRMGHQQGAASLTATPNWFGCTSKYLLNVKDIHPKVTICLYIWINI